MSVIVGAMYCKIPNVVNGMRLAPLAKYNSGNAVTTPAPINKISVVKEIDRKDDDPFIKRIIM